jgi:hypothetical protein
LNLKRIILTVFAVITTIIGWGMWKEPHLNFNILLSLIVDEIIRLMGDPFAIFGFMLMILGLWLIFMLTGPWNLPSNIEEILERKHKSDEI